MSSEYTANPPQTRILRLPEVIHLTGLSRASIYRLMKDGLFPASMKLTKRCIGWLESAINAWMAARASESLAIQSASPRKKTK